MFYTTGLCYFVLTALEMNVSGTRLVLRTMESRLGVLRPQCAARMEGGMQGGPVEMKLLEELAFRLVSECPGESPQGRLNGPFPSVKSGPERRLSAGWPKWPELSPPTTDSNDTH